MSTTKDAFLCRRCGRAVEASEEQFETFERDTLRLFHYEFEHDPFDTHQECAAGGCPSGALGGGRDAAAVTALLLAAEAGRAPGWENENLPAYLEALAAWLDGCESYYANHRRVVPSTAGSSSTTPSRPRPSTNEIRQLRLGRYVRRGGLAETAGSARSGFARAS